MFVFPREGTEYSLLQRSGSLQHSRICADIRVIVGNQMRNMLVSFCMTNQRFVIPNACISQRRPHSRCSLSLNRSTRKTQTLVALTSQARSPRTMPSISACSSVLEKSARGDWNWCDMNKSQNSKSKKGRKLGSEKFVLQASLLLHAEHAIFILVRIYISVVATLGRNTMPLHLHIPLFRNGLSDWMHTQGIELGRR